MAWLGSVLLILGLYFEDEIRAWLVAQAEEKREKARELKLANDEKENAK